MIKIPAVAVDWGNRVKPEGGYDPAGCKRSGLVCGVSLHSAQHYHSELAHSSAMHHTLTTGQCMITLT